MNCKECVHSDICERFTDDVAIICKKFKNKADFVEVVRCADCVARGKAKLEPFVCSRNKILVYNNSYCCYGKKAVRE